MSGMGRRARIYAATAVAGAVTVLVGVVVPASFADAPSAAARTAAAEQKQNAAAELSPEEMLRRAATWLTANNGSQVPYSQTKTWSDGYRQDCSGYVSMTLGLWKSGPNTVELASNRELTTPIGLGDLRPGDLLIDADGSNTTRHVVIFEKWTDSSHSAYSAFEQRGGHGTDHRVLDYGLDSGSEYKPYRPVKLTGEAPPETPPSAQWPMLTQGDSGADVTAAQYLLRDHGHMTDADGAYGPKTAEQAKAFQAGAGLVADGEIGPKTWPELVEPVKSGAQGDAVRAAQTQLNVYGAGLTVDGEFGPATEKAVTDFQKAHGLTVDGLVGPRTWEALVGTR
ncbi:peptidoglycan-binding protein [Streptomyces ovatisporus]|uniref:Peptidoglycan-binding protein n=1 Tax=Streptomyces ovatisporus TaxID=1128682 RepID=A0ABV9A464_9ACTN